MTLKRIGNTTRNTLLVQDLRVANTFWSRLRGLLGTASLPAGQGLLITPCSSIHMFGMRYALDVIFLDRDFKVRKILYSLPPGATARCPGSAHVLELSGGTLSHTAVSLNDQLTIMGDDS